MSDSLLLYDDQLQLRPENDPAAGQLNSRAACSSSSAYAIVSQPFGESGLLICAAGAAGHIDLFNDTSHRSITLTHPAYPVA